MDRLLRLRGRGQPANERPRPADEETPLMGDGLIHVDYDDTAGDAHKQFCLLVGISPSDLPPNQKPPPSSENKLYERAKAKRRSQNIVYQATAIIGNALLLLQIILGALLTALGASGANHLIITIFGVLNTVIAGLVAYLKSRGQPMRARMFLDDLDAVVNEIQNAEIMWLGVSRGAHGYDELDVDDKLSVRSEVARLTHMFNKAVDQYIKNNPDNVQGQDGSQQGSSLKSRGDGKSGTVFGSGPHAGGGHGAAAATGTEAESDDEGPAAKKDIEQANSGPSARDKAGGATKPATTKPGTATPNAPAPDKSGSASQPDAIGGGDASGATSK